MRRGASLYKQLRNADTGSCIVDMFTTVQFVLAALLATSSLSAPWPTFFQPCATSSPEFDECAKKNLQVAVEKFSEGVPEFDVPAFDPMLVPELLLEYRQDGVQGQSIIRNSKSTGLKHAEILAVRTNLSDHNNVEVAVDFRIPSVFIEGEYKAEGKIVAFPISGKGVYNISMRDVSGTWDVRGHLVTVDGEQHLKAHHVYMYPEVGDMKVHASNLFTGSDQLNKAALKFVNLYWRAFYKELLPFAAEGWDKFLRGLLNRVLLKVPYSTIFPEN